MSIKTINNFLRFDKKIVNYDNSDLIELWFCIRYNVYVHYLTNDSIRQLYRSTSKKKSLFKIIYNLLFYFFQTIKIILFIFNKKKILEIDVGRYKIYEKEKNSTISHILKKNKIDSQTISLSYNSKIFDKKINIIFIVKIVYFFLKLTEKFKKKNKNLLLIEKEFNNFFQGKNKRNVNFLDIYKSIYLQQVSIYLVIKFFIKLFRYKKIVYLENPSLSKLIIYCGKTQIKTFDIQHAMISKLSVMYNFYINKKYEYIFSKKIIIWGSYWKKFFSKNHRCINLGYLEYSKKFNSNKKKQIFIAGSGYERKQLVNLLHFLSTNLNNYKIIYKLRPEENFSEFKKLINFSSKNITFLEKIPEQLLKKTIAESQYVIGTNSTLLVESINLSTVIVYRKGWYKEFNDLIKKKVFLSGKNCKDILNLIKNNKLSKNKITQKTIFKKPHKNLLKILLEK
jgi:hypothetical protein